MNESYQILSEMIVQEGKLIQWLKKKVEQWRTVKDPKKMQHMTLSMKQIKKGKLK